MQFSMHHARTSIIICEQILEGEENKSRKKKKVADGGGTTAEVLEAEEVPPPKLISFDANSSADHIIKVPALLSAP